MQTFRRYFHGLPHVLLIMCASALLAAPAVATPAEEITQAVAANSIDVSAARPKQFLKAFTAVALRTQPRELPDYVTAAITIRPDLGPNIVAVAIKAAVKNWEEKPAALCAMIDRIIRAAAAADPDGVVAIAKAGSWASPESRHCVVNAAISAAPHAREAILQAATTRTIPFAFLTFSATDYSGFSFSPATLSPANISNPGDNGSVNSPEQPPSH